VGIGNTKLWHSDGNPVYKIIMGTYGKGDQRIREKPEILKKDLKWGSRCQVLEGIQKRGS
jgi:hypothetical protein